MLCDASMPYTYIDILPIHKVKHVSFLFFRIIKLPTILTCLCAQSTGFHVECLHIDLETFSLGKRINNFTMQEGNRNYQLQIALTILEKIYSIY